MIYSVIVGSLNHVHLNNRLNRKKLKMENKEERKKRSLREATILSIGERDINFRKGRKGKGKKEWK